MKRILIGCLCMAMSLATLAQTKTAKTLGRYTSIEEKDCIVVESSELEKDAEIDFLSMKCQSFGGYDVEISGGDIRYNLKLSFEGKEIQTPSPSSFHDMGSKLIEWRYSRVKNAEGRNELKLWALIYRINKTVEDDNGKQSTESTLHVVRLKGKDSCLVASVSSKTRQKLSQEQMALLSAEDESLPCLSTDQE